MKSLDATDIQYLEFLEKRSNATYADIALCLGVTTAAAHYRVMKLKRRRYLTIKQNRKVPISDWRKGI